MAWSKTKAAAVLKIDGSREENARLMRGAEAWLRSSAMAPKLVLAFGRKGVSSHGGRRLELADSAGTVVA